MKFILVLLFSSFTFLASAQTDTLVAVYDSSIAFSTPIVETKKTNPKAGEVYKLKNAIDLPLTAVETAYTLWGFSQIYGREKTPESVILALDPNDVNSLDRRVTKYYSLKAKDASDMLFYGSMPLPLILMLDKEMRKDAGKIGLLYLQAMATTGVLYTSSSMIADRFRPYTYNDEVEMSRRTGGGGKNSFFAGHPALVATSVFFVAKTYSDYHPEMKNKWILYTLAGSAAVTTGVLRVKAGEHFISDVMVGIPVGVLSGILIPHFHKIKPELSSRLSLMPVYQKGGAGFAATWKLN